MRQSDGRILTTHAGSLPRPAPLVELYVRRDRDQPVDPGELDKRVREATARILLRQLEVGIDVPNDGEQGRASFFADFARRVTGFGERAQRPMIRDLALYPSFLEKMRGQFSGDFVSAMQLPKCVGPVAYVDRAPIERELSTLEELVGPHRDRFAEVFVTAPSPGIIAAALPNAHYDRFEDYVAAIAAALRVEYQAIAARGFALRGRTAASTPSRDSAASRRSWSGESSNPSAREPTWPASACSAEAAGVG